MPASSACMHACIHAHIHYLEPQKDRLYSIEHLQHNQALIITCYETF